MKFLFLILIVTMYFNALSPYMLVSNQAYYVYADTDDLVFSVEDMPYNHTFSYWVDKWFNWFSSFQVSPRENYSSTICSMNQNIEEPVWMLADGDDLEKPSSMGEIRECQVPAGKGMLVQIVGSNCSTDEYETYPTDEELFDCAEWILPEAKFSASVDGVEVMNTAKNPSDREKFYVEPFITNLTYPAGNTYGATPGTFRAMEAGYFLFVKPLETGNHTIKFHEEVGPKLLEGGEYEQRLSDVTYNIQIQNTTK
jgi:hypothetical protein